MSDLEIAIDCYERIARFHILSLHQLALPEKPYDKYDWYQEREQLDRTLLSLMQYYDDTKGRLESPNEPEFRAYCVIFQAQDPNPDLEERVNAWEPRIKQDLRIRKALDVYGAACNILDPQGPLKPRAIHPVAQEDWNHFFALVRSDSISYLTACVSEIYFNLMRRAALNAIWRSFRPLSKYDVPDFTISMMTDVFAFDDWDQTEHFCQQYGFVFKEVPNVSEPFLDLNSVQGKSFPQAAQGMPHQTFSERIVEVKRAGRTLPAIISGFNVRKAQDEGLVEEIVEDDSQMEDEESLFVPDDRVTQPASFVSPFAANNTASSGTSASPFAPSTAPANPTAEVEKTWSFSSQLTNPSEPSTSTTPTFATLAAPASNPFGFVQSSTKPAASPFAVGQPSPATASSSDKDANVVKFPAQPSSGIGQRPSSPFGQQPQSVFGQPKSSLFDQQSAASTRPLDEPTKSALSFDFAKPRASTSPPTPEASNSLAPKQSPFTFGQTNLQEQEARSPFTTQQTASAVFAPLGQISSPFSFTKPTTPSFTPTTGSIHPDSTPASSAETSFASPEPLPAISKSTNPLFQSSVIQQSDQKDCSEGNLPKIGESDASKDTEHPLQSAQQESGSPFSSIGNDVLPSSSSGSPPKAAPSLAPPAKTAFSAPVQPNQPKKPSPLSQSFSAVEDVTCLSQSSPAVEGETGTKTGDRVKVDTASTNHIIGSPSGITPNLSSELATPQRSNPPRSKATILEDLAREVILDNDTGFLRQYVEFHARQIILDVYDKLYMENLQQLADNFRMEKLSYRYGKRWRDICWRRRLVRQGREKRKRTQKHQHAKELERKLAAETNAVDDFLKSMQERKPGSGVLNHSQVSREGSRQRHHNMEVPSSGAESHGNGHQRPTKRTDHLDDAGRVSKPQVPRTRDSTPVRSQLSRTNGSQSTSSVPASTRSNYFRLRSLGIDPNAGVTATSLAKKRAREDSEDYAAETPVARKTRPLSHSDPGLLRVHQQPDVSPKRSLGLTPSQRRSTSGDEPLSKTFEDDEALFARARAARQMLSDSAAWYRSEVRKEEAQRGQAVSRMLDSPSMQRAREQARLRASGGSTMTFGSSISSSALTPQVPAYRLRESRFVPREQYGHAIERAKEMVETRSRTPTQQSSYVGSPSMGSVGRIYSQKLEKMGESAVRAQTSQAYQFARSSAFEGTHPAMAPMPPTKGLANGTFMPSTFDPDMLNGSIDPRLQGWAGEALDGQQPDEHQPAESVHGTEDEGEDGEEDEGEEDGEEEEEDFDEEDDGFVEGQDYDEEEEEGYYDEDEEIGESESEVEHGNGLYGMPMQRAVNGGQPMTSTIKAGTGTAEDAFELSD